MLSPVDAAADLLLGSRCPGCRAPAWRLCADCREVLMAESAVVVTRHLPGFPAAVAANVYAGPARALVAAAKDGGVWSAAGPLADRLALAVRGVMGPQRSLVLVPVPSSPAAVRRRGRDAVCHLARLTSRRLGRDVQVTPVLAQRRRVADQGALDSAGRSANLAGSLVATRAVAGPVVVVDDVITTGATVTEAVRALEASGVEVVGAAAVAATVLRRNRGG